MHGSLYHSPEELITTQAELFELASAHSDQQHAAELLIDIAHSNAATDLYMSVQEASTDRSHPHNQDGLYEMRAQFRDDPVAVATYVLGLGVVDFSVNA